MWKINFCYTVLPKKFAHPVALSANNEAGPLFGDILKVLQENDLLVEVKQFGVSQICMALIIVI